MIVWITGLLILGITGLCLRSRVNRFLAVKELRAQVDQSTQGPIDLLDPSNDRDVLLFGELAFARIRLFDLCQRGYLKINGDRFLATDVKSHNLTALEAEVLSEAGKDSDKGAKAGGLLSTILEHATMAGKKNSAEQHHLSQGLVYPEECEYQEEGAFSSSVGSRPDLLPLIFGPFIFCSLTAFLGDSFEQVLGRGLNTPQAIIWLLGSLAILASPWICNMIFAKQLSGRYTARGREAVALMEERWAGKEVVLSEDPEVQKNNLAVLGALGMVALAGTPYATFADAFPSAVSTGAYASDGGCGGGGGCSSCGGGGDGGGGGGGCGGGCGGCGGG